VDRPVDNARPMALGAYPSAFAASRTRTFVASDTRGWSLKARETVGCETPASLATSRLVTMLCASSRSPHAT
jgi:hypothetical protein